MTSTIKAPSAGATDLVPYTELNSRVAYWRRNNAVTVRINTDNTAISSGTEIGTLPEGFRPPAQCDFAGTAKGGDATSVFFRVDTNGRIRAYANVTTVYWSGTFSFSAI